MVNLFLRPMKVFGHIILFASLLFLGVISCSEDEEQEEGISPFIEVTFINARELLAINTEIDNIDEMIETIDDRITQIDTAENKGDLLDEKDSLNDVKSDLNAQKSALNTTASKISNGEINLAQIVGEGSSEVIVARSTDSTEVHTFPLNGNSPMVRFFPSITLGENLSRQDTLDFEYELTTIFSENQISLVASDLNIPFHSYDSVLLTCRDSTCISNEAQLTVYF